MKRYGFTLAEVLITLGIIGVVSAMVIPTFTQSTQNAKIGPKLAKAVAGFEQATKACLNDEEADSLIGAGIATSDNFRTNLSHHMKGANFTNIDGKASYLAADGASYTVESAFNTITGEFPHLTVAANEVMIDINGDAGPNKNARDRFYFQLMDDGSLKPWGGSHMDINHTWSKLCKKNITAGDYKYCAGHVMENGLKVEYK